MSGSTRYGVLLPHFGAAASRQRIIDGARLAEELGFDSVWARDQVAYRPHAYDDQDRTFIDPVVTLTAAAAVTARIALGFAVMIPHRHPINAAVCLASMDFVAGPGRVIVGLGIGNDPRQLALVGMRGANRGERFSEYVEILRGLWRAEPFSFHGNHFQFEDVALAPRPAGGTLPIWYGGGFLTDVVVERAVTHCDGAFVTTRRAEFVRKRDLMAKVAARLGRPMPTLAANIAVVPLEREEELREIVDLPRLFQATWGVPHADDAQFSSSHRVVEAFDGALIAGSADAIGEEVAAWKAIGCEHFVFNLRHRHERFEQWLSLIGQKVLPALRNGTAAPRSDARPAPVTVS